MKRIFVVTKDGKPLSDSDKWSVNFSVFPEDAKNGEVVVFSKEFYSKPAKLLPDLADGDYVAIVEKAKGKPRHTICIEVDGELRDFLNRNSDKATYAVITLYSELCA